MDSKGKEREQRVKVGRRLFNGSERVFEKIGDFNHLISATILTKIPWSAYL
ncbi:hypothetical protein N665_1268s0001 [Sinapis alba]|nr:hypothetical protein N665_1268s0001 [Sinapis alba]